MSARVLEFYRRVITPEFVKTLRASRGVGCRAGIYESATVIWLMIFQRLNADHSLTAALEELKLGHSNALLTEENGSIRARTSRISESTGGYAQARQRVSLEEVIGIADRLNSAIESIHLEQQYEGRKVYLIDGSTVRIDHTPENLGGFPATQNQHGEAHYPLMRIGVATDVVTGISLRPAYGAYTGPNAVSEHALADELFSRLSAGSVLIGDRYYGCFRFAYGANRLGHDVVMRMQESKIKPFIGRPSTASGEIQINWTPSAVEWKKHKHFPSDAAVSGRMIWCTVHTPGFKPLRLYLFTTLTLPIESIVKLYGLRWNVETDLRDIKSTLDIDFIHAKSPTMAAKELILGICAYNLIRHVMAVAAYGAKINPRRLSFSRFLKRVRALANSPLHERALEKALDQTLTQIDKLKIPAREKQRPTEPRKQWPTGELRLMRGSRQEQREQLRAGFSTT